MRDDTSVLGRVGARGGSLRFPAAKSGVFRRSRLEISRVQWSRDGRYVYTVDDLRGPGRQPSTYFAWTHDRRPRALENARAVRPCRCRRPETHRGDHPGRPGVPLLLQRRLGDLFVVDGLK